MSRFIYEKGGWVISVPGASSMTVECLPGSGLPDEPRKFGYELTPEPPGERIRDLANIVHDITASRGAQAPQSYLTAISNPKIRRPSAV